MRVFFDDELAIYYPDKDDYIDIINEYVDDYEKKINISYDAI